MKKIINKNKKRLTFPSLNISIEPNEIKKVLEHDYEILIRNNSIKEVMIEKKINKGRNKNNIIKK